MKWYGVLLLTAAIITGNSITAQIRVNGVVKEEQTGSPLSFVSVGLLHSDIGGLTDEQGRFSLETTDNTDSIRVSMIGYKEIILPVNQYT